MNEYTEPGGSVCQRLGKVQIVFHGGPALSEDIAYFRQIRQNCATPIAMGELFNNPHEWQSLMSETLDRLHPRASFAGGRAYAGRKIAILGESFGRQGPPGTAPVMYRRSDTWPMSPSMWSATISESRILPVQRTSARSVSRLPRDEGWVSLRQRAPGWGIEVNEKAAAKYPFGYGEQGGTPEV